jgi:hypothetical protein
MNTNEIIRSLQDFQKLRIDLLKESQISALGKKIRNLFETTENEVRFQEINSRIYELNQNYYPNYFKAKLKLVNADKPPKTKDLNILTKYLEKLKLLQVKFEKELNVSLAQLKKIQKVLDNESIEILLHCEEAELEDLELITNVKLRKEIASYKQAKLTATQNSKTLTSFKKAEKKILDSISKIKMVRETGLV